MLRCCSWIEIISANGLNKSLTNLSDKFAQVSRLMVACVLALPSKALIGR